MKDQTIGRIRELTELLNSASKAYYSENREIMSNFEYDALYDELVSLEKESGIVLANSPTQTVGYEASRELLKEAHETPALSLDKTKEIPVLADFLRDHKGLLSWKLDGLTIVLTYEDGKLQKAVTRGNGEIGEVVTANARTFVNLPLRIPFPGKLVLRGEAVIRYSDFRKINREIPETESKYKNPRNLCSGSVRQLDPSVTASRNVHILIFALVDFSGKEEADFHNSNKEKYEWLKTLGFDVVPFEVVDKDTIGDAVAGYAEEIKTFDIPSDGLVLLLDDIAFGNSLGRTAKFPRNAIAYKWQDEIAETSLLRVEWSPSRTGLINPVAVFDPVELEGTSVSRASLHNVSIMEGLKLGIGDRILVYKANMIIPQIADNLTKSGNLEIPALCPSCECPTHLRVENDVKTLICPNPACSAKKIRLFTDFVSRNAMNIEGISEETLEKFIARGFIHEFADIFRLKNHREEIISMEGFGEKSCENLLASIDAARNTTMDRLVNSLAIPGIGPQNSRMLCRFFDYDFDRLRKATQEDLMQIDGIGDVLAENITAYFSDDDHRRLIDELLKEIRLEKTVQEASAQNLAGKTFVITGSLNHYENRDQLKAAIELRGGKVSGSVSSRTDYLINNDSSSGSSKNRKAKELNIPVITEDMYISMFES